MSCIPNALYNAIKLILFLQNSNSHAENEIVMNKLRFHCDFILSVREFENDLEKEYTSFGGVFVSCNKCLWLQNESETESKEYEMVKPFVMGTNCKSNG